MKTLKNKTPVRPCPFCGASPKSRFVKIAKTTSEMWCVACIHCGCRGPAAPTFEKAIQLWNLATASPAPISCLCSDHGKHSVGLGMCFHAEDALKEGKPARLWTPVLCDKCMRLIALFKPGQRFCGQDNFAMCPDGTMKVIRGKKCICKAEK